MTNDTGKDIAIDGYGILTGSMMQGKTHTVILKLTARYIRICFNLSQSKVRVESRNFNMVAATVKALDNEGYNIIFGVSQQAGDAV